MKNSFHFGLTGWPLGHSFSPILHQAALSSVGLPGDYRCYPIPSGSGGIASLRILLQRLRDGELDGLNVTIPYKQAVSGMLDELSETARKIGAVNTIRCEAGKLWGENTDSPGFWQDLIRLYPEAAQGGQALILGAGGAGRAVTYALLQNGWQVILAARRVEQAREVQEDFSPMIKVMTLEAKNLKSISTVQLVVNTTPLGMAPQVDMNPWPGEVPLPEGAMIYDLIYNPERTLLVKNAQRMGLQASNGLGMLVEQAALAFEIWSGASPDRRQMMQAALDGFHVQGVEQ